jgi:arginyl-tRNA synthetase
MNLLKRLQQHFAAALGDLCPDPAPYLAMIRPAQDAKFGDYQANFAMSLGKALGKPPRDVAQAVVSKLSPGDFIEKAEVAGPGFINVRIAGMVAARKRETARSRLGVEAASLTSTL